MPIQTTFKEPSIFESIVNFIGMFGFVALIGTIIVLVFKLEKIKELTNELTKLKRAFDELDGQAKLIVQTDLELHRTQEELDKKISGLVTLQKLTRLISTTLDEEEIYKKIEEKYVTELGFDRALAFCRDDKGNLHLKTLIGYTVQEGEKILKEFINHRIILDKVLDKNQIFSSLDTDKSSKEIPAFMTTLDVASFVCAPITQKNGAIGALVMGCESQYTHLTEGDRDIVYILATQIGQATENAKLFEETWRSQQELEHKIQQRTKELSEALEAIKTISKRKSDFISAVSHELRTPLTSIKGYASILAAGKLGELPQQAKERIEKINKHSDNLSQLINNLLDISRIESGRVEMKFEPISIKAMVESLSDMLAPPMKEKGIELVTDIPNDTPFVKADRSQLDRVFINLVGNAIKFVPLNAGKITIKAKALDHDMVQVSISDNGIGISEKDLTKLGEEFFRVDNDVNAKVKGTGLGLSLVKHIIEAHQGKLSISSILGKGSTFSFTLPKA